MEPSRESALQEVNAILDDLHEEFQRRQDQAILQQDLYKANYALAGKETCSEVKRRLEQCLRMHDNVVRNMAERKRA